jgi:hypothetical protein
MSTAATATLPVAVSGDVLLETSSEYENGRRRFVISVAIGFLVVTIPYLWVLCDNWTGTLNPFRKVVDGNIYDVQGRALLAGHLSVPPGSLGFEAFQHSGKQFTYFGLFPSVLRMPILFVTHGLDGKLTGASMLLAWLATGVLSSLLLWRVRVLLRGPVALGTVEATAYGVLVALITGGSVLIILAATLQAFEEDLAWSVALTLGALFALLGVLERPSRGRIALTAVFVFCAAMNRGSTGYACILGTLLVAGWFALGRMGRDNRRWTVPLLLIGVIPWALLVVLNLAKFGHPLGFSETEQFWTSLDHHRQVFLAANGNDPFGLQFLPSTLTAYLRPGGLRFSSFFPYVALPPYPAPIIGHVVFDATDPTLSVPSSMPLAAVLSIWGVVTAFRPRAIRQVRLTRIPLLVAAVASTGVLLFGYIALRYLADFLPFLILASMIGAVDVLRRLENTGGRVKWLTLTVLSLLAAFTLWTNLGVAVNQPLTWTAAQGRAFVSAQRSFGAEAVSSHMSRSSALPLSAPAGTLVDVNNCDGLYFSTGLQTSDLPSWLAEHSTWLPLEQSGAITHTLKVVFNRPITRNDPTIPVMRFGQATLDLIPIGPNQLRLKLEHPARPYAQTVPVSGQISIRPHRPYKVQLTVDPHLGALTTTGFGVVIGPETAGQGNLEIDTGSRPGPNPAVTITKLRPTTNPVALCQELARTRSPRAITPGYSLRLARVHS